MKAKLNTFLSIIGSPNTQFVVPPFQRVYSWTERECTDLVDDILESGKVGEAHFAGTMLYVEMGNSEDGISQLQVIDGQQRLTTITLLLLAFAMHLEAGDSDDAAFAMRIREEYLTCKMPELSPKLVLTSIDADMLAYLLGIAEEPVDEAARLSSNLELFKHRISQPGFDCEVFWRGMELLQAIAIETTSEDSPQEVFESLNAKGKRLAIEDLVRNALLLDASKSDEPYALYEELWLTLEDAMEGIKGIGMEELLCSWLASRHDDLHLHSKSEVYPLFKDDLADGFRGSYRLLLEDLSKYADSFTASEQFRRDEMHNMDRWLQGKPKRLISEVKMFGD